MTRTAERSTGRMPPGPCLDAAAIERLVMGGERSISREEEAHVSLCAACRARLDAALDDAAFTTRARSLIADELPPAGAPRLTGYRILRVISAGAQGVVYRAVQEATQRAVAIKAFSTGDEADGTGLTPVTTKGHAATRRRHRAEREVEIIARLRHPNIVSVYESRTLQDGRLAVVMEFIDGKSIDDWGADVPTREGLRAFVDVCSGVHHAHLNGVIHRDLKPDNILVTADTSTGTRLNVSPGVRPVVVDFGIAKLGFESLRTTMTGEFAGTPAYASPEQVAGKRDGVDALTDVYSLGVVLYKMVSGGLPYDVGGSIFEMARVIAEVEPAPLRARDGRPADKDLGAIVRKALRKEKSERYQSAAALARDLERYLAGEPVEARGDSGWYVLRKALLLNKRKIVAASVAGVALLAAGVAVVMSLSSAADARRQAALNDKQAHTERTRARAVAELLREVLPNDEPDRPEIQRVIGQGYGRLFYRLETGAYAGDEGVDQEVRRLWGRVYTGFGGAKPAAAVEYAEVSLRNGLVRLREEHAGINGDHKDIADTMHQLAGVLLVRRRLAEAETICSDTLAMRRRLGLVDSLDAAESLALLARIRHEAGRPTDAATTADEALRLLTSLPENDASLLSASMRALHARLLLDRPSLSETDAASCEALIREALERRMAKLVPEDPDLLASLTDAALFAERYPSSKLSLLLAGAWGEAASAEKMSVPSAVRSDTPLLAAPDRGTYKAYSNTRRARALSRLATLQETLLGKNHPALVSTLMAVMRSAEGEYELELRAAAALRAADILAAATGKDDFAVMVCLTEAASVKLFYDDTDRGAAIAKRICDAWDKFPHRDELMAADAYRFWAWTLALAGRHDQAVSVYEEARGRLKKAVGDKHHTYMLTTAMHAFSLNELGRRAEALAAAREAMALLPVLTYAPRDQASHVRFCCGHVLFQDPATREEARPLLRHAYDNQYFFFGPGGGEAFGASRRKPFPWYTVIVADLTALGEPAPVRPALPERLPPHLGVPLESPR